jgi:hypothetical protein
MEELFGQITALLEEQLVRLESMPLDNTHLSNNETQKVIIIHPFHPFYKQEFASVDK